jgi:Zn-dependent metalloprotease
LARYFSDTYDFFKNIFNRNSLDGNGLAIIGNVHLGNKYQNAFWQPDKKMMYFGDNADNSPPYPKANDVVAHEFTHGVTQYEVPPDGLTYINQSGALNESYSDLFSVVLDYQDW